ncbi:MAG: pantoate--beta-alanine ligase, partial [Chitinophagaceae bacterium]
EYRPGHFQGVCRIVDKLLTAVQPDRLYLGQKDYQQCMVISKLIELEGIDTILQVCDTVREPDGLAMSSRNMRLNEKERVQALHIAKTLKYIKDNIPTVSIDDLTTAGTQYLEKEGFRVDYVAVADAENLQVLQNWDRKRPVVVLIAAFLNEVRLIDNLVIFPPGNP